MEYKPFVSVIMNNYNYAEYIAEAVESVINQTYRDFELIIVDDGSTDGSRKILNSYHKKYAEFVKVILKGNGGQASALNEGYAASKGDVVCFLDSDDYWYPDKLREVIKYHQEYGIVQHNLLVNGKEKYMYLSNDADWQVLLKEFGYVRGLIPTSGISIKREILEKVFPLPVGKFKIGADAFIRWNSMYFSPIYSLDKALGFYRVHGNNIFYSRYSQENILEFVNIIKKELNLKLKSMGYSEIPFDKEYPYLDLIAKSININSDSTFLLYGTGSLSTRFTEYIEEKGGSVVFYSDSNSEKWGTSFMGKPVIPPHDICKERKKFDKILVASCFIREILITLEKLGFEGEKDIITSVIL